MHLWVLPARASVTPSNKRRFHIYWRQLALCAFPSHVWLAVVKVTQLSIKPDTLFYGCSLSNQCTATESHHHTVSVGPLWACACPWVEQAALSKHVPEEEDKEDRREKSRKMSLRFFFFFRDCRSSISYTYFCVVTGQNDVEEKHRHSILDIAILQDHIGEPWGFIPL